MKFLIFIFFIFENYHLIFAQMDGMNSMMNGQNGGMGSQMNRGPKKIIPGDDDEGEIYPGFSLDNILNGGTGGTGRSMSSGRSNFNNNMGGGGSGYYGMGNQMSGGMGPMNRGGGMEMGGGMGGSQGSMMNLGMMPGGMMDTGDVLGGYGSNYGSEKRLDVLEMGPNDNFKPQRQSQSNMRQMAQPQDSMPRISIPPYSAEGDDDKEVKPIIRPLKR
uniref:Uncharacterized protein n=1 Tax=Meloidogyne enterolobii TaxID=390850 RepID=A0A6V7X2L2_MELEN|nr:unnamed protein product [Meloidogyne enterolobii]